MAVSNTSNQFSIKQIEEEYYAFINELRAIQNEKLAMLAKTVEEAIEEEHDQSAAQSEIDKIRDEYYAFASELNSKGSKQNAGGEGSKGIDERDDRKKTSTADVRSISSKHVTSFSDFMKNKSELIDKNKLQIINNQHAVRIKMLVDKHVSMKMEPAKPERQNDLQKFKSFVRRNKIFIDREKR